MSCRFCGNGASRRQGRSHGDFMLRLQISRAIWALLVKDDGTLNIDLHRVVRGLKIFRF